jgi:hypothetical protein
MPIHDWTRVDSDLFHDFHQSWTVALRNTLNAGGLPPNFFALIDQPRWLRRSEARSYTERANRICIRNRHGDVIAVIGIVSAGNKASRSKLRTFVKTTADLIRRGIHLLVIDLFPPGPRDPKGIHKAIWDQFLQEEHDLWLPPDKPLTLVSYESGSSAAVYLDIVAVGDVLPDMPLFLAPESYVMAPLEATYQETWRLFPAPHKRLLELPPKPSDGPSREV